MKMSNTFWNPKAAAEKLLIDLKQGKAASVRKAQGGAETFEIFNVSERYARGSYIVLKYKGEELKNPDQVSTAVMYSRQSDANRTLDRIEGK